MVRIVDYNEQMNEEGKPFFVLVLQGGIEFVRSLESNRLYATMRQTSLACTFDEETCARLIGLELPGRIKKVVTSPYEYTIKDTGETIRLQHRWEYSDQEPVKEAPKIEVKNKHLHPSGEADLVTINEVVEQSDRSFSLNGIE